MYSNTYQWKRIRRRVLVGKESIRFVALSERMSRNTIRKILQYEFPPGYRSHEVATVTRNPLKAESNTPRVDLERTRWKEWVYAIERGELQNDPLALSLDGLSLNARKLVIAAMAQNQSFSQRAIAEHLCLSRNTVRRRLAAYNEDGIDGLLGRRPRPLKIDDESFTKALFSLLHEPPSLSGFNRTTWRMTDLRETLANRGHAAGSEVVRQAMKRAGFKWRSAKVVLTSTDPKYRERLERVQSILAALGEDERFFSIDEYGPFAVKAKPGRVLAGPGENPSVPQWQKSKGWLIVTAALELSRNQITHFYSRAKNTTEMIKMVQRLLEEYGDVRTLYLSWDAASWHMSKELLAFVDTHNRQSAASPRLELVPLPASAQFLNVIESVFSGMARAIIHRSDYSSVNAACEAIDRYFAERNRHYADNPKRAGKRIWGKERTEVEFDPANNCKDPAYR